MESWMLMGCDISRRNLRAMLTHKSEDRLRCDSFMFWVIHRGSLLRMSIR